MPLRLAQLNIATLRQPMDHPDTAGFADGLDPVNSLHPDSRGSKLGAAILATIVQAATADGYNELKLETGEHRTAAVGLYTRFGTCQCPPWGEYIFSPLSYCHRLTLDASAPDSADNERTRP